MIYLFWEHILNYILILKLKLDYELDLLSLFIILNINLQNPSLNES